MAGKIVFLIKPSEATKDGKTVSAQPVSVYGVNDEHLTAFEAQMKVSNPDCECVVLSTSAAPAPAPVVP